MSDTNNFELGDVVYAVRPTSADERESGPTWSEEMDRIVGIPGVIDYKYDESYHNWYCVSFKLESGDKYGKKNPRYTFKPSWLRRKKKVIG